MNSFGYEHRQIRIKCEKRLPCGDLNLPEQWWLKDERSDAILAIASRRVSGKWIVCSEELGLEPYSVPCLKAAAERTALAILSQVQHRLVIDGTTISIEKVSLAPNAPVLITVNNHAIAAIQKNGEYTYALTSEKLNISAKIVSSVAAALSYIAQKIRGGKDGNFKA